jgi:hypothetical protein
MENALSGVMVSVGMQKGSGGARSTVERSRWRSQALAY